MRVNECVGFLGPIGWPELVLLFGCCGLLLIVGGVVLVVLSCSGALGRRQDPPDGV